MSVSLRHLIAALICICVYAVVAPAQINPASAQILQGSESASPRGLPGLSQSAEQQAPPNALERFILQVRQKQQELQRDLVKVIRKMKSDETNNSLYLLLFASFIYGIFHAAGPGHGKMVISSYLLASEDQLRRGIKLTFLSSAAQAVSAILLVGVLAIALDLSRLEVTSQTRTLEIASYILVVGIGLWMLNGAVRGKGCGHDHGHGGHTHADHSQHDHADHDHADHGHSDHNCGGHHHREHAHSSHGQSPSTAKQVTGTGLRQYLGIILAVGIRPCSGAVIVLLFTLAQGLLLAGIAATFAMALGTAITVATLAILSVTSRKVALRLAHKDSPWQRRVQIGMSVAGSLLVISTGGILLIATLDQTTLL